MELSVSFPISVLRSLTFFFFLVALSLKLFGFFGFWRVAAADPDEQDNWKKWVL